MISNIKNTIPVVDTPLHFETSYIKISHTPGSKYVEVIWKGFANEEQFREVLLKEASIVKNAKVDALLIDGREFKGSTPVMQKWIDSEWSKIASKAGLKYFSLLVSGDIFQTITLNNALGENFAKFIIFEKFTDWEKAKQWLADKVK